MKWEGRDYVSDGALVVHCKLCQENYNAVISNDLIVAWNGHIYKLQLEIANVLVIELTPPSSILLCYILFVCTLLNTG